MHLMTSAALVQVPSVLDFSQSAAQVEVLSEPGTGTTLRLVVPR